MIRLDQSATSVVAVCTDCRGQWRALRATMADAHAAAVEHQAAVHGNAAQASAAAARYTQRNTRTGSADVRATLDG